MTDKERLFESRHQHNIAAGSGWCPADFQAEVLEALTERLARTGLNGGRLIEFGCGTGENVRGFIDQGWEVAGLELSPSAVEEARRRGPGEFYCFDLSVPLTVDLPPADVVLDGYAYHFQIGGARPVYLGNARRCLKPGGWLILNSHVGAPTSESVDYDPTSKTSSMTGVAMNYHADLEELEDELRAAGFEVMDSEVYEGQVRIGVVWARLA